MTVALGDSSASASVAARPGRGRALLIQLLFVLAGTAAVLLGSAAARKVLSPYRLLPRDRPWLLIGDCPYSLAAFRTIEASPIMPGRIVPVPTLDMRHDSGAEVCPFTLRQLAAAGHPWVAWLPTTIACRWLARDAEAFFDRHFVAFPSFSVGERPLEDEEVRGELLARGIRIDPGPGGTMRLVPRESPAPATPPTPPPAADPPGAAGEPSPPLNQPIGW